VVTPRPIKVVLAKAGLDGHDRGVRVVANALRDAGMEVVYLGLRQTPEMIAEAAVQEDADVVGVSLLSAAHMTLLPRVKRLLDDRGLSRVVLAAGGIFPPEDARELQALEIGPLFGPGATMRDLVQEIARAVAERAARRGKS
jgi:methylmalonyl-CoA mutase C-terminal domain/subunit